MGYFDKSPLERERMTFEHDAEHQAEAIGDGVAMEAQGRHLGVFVRELVKDGLKRSNLEVRNALGVPYKTTPEDLVHALCDACGFDTAIMREAALEELGK